MSELVRNRCEKQASNDDEDATVIERVEDAVNTGVPTEGDAKTAPSGGSLLDDLNTEGQSAPTTGVPTDQ
ncbi:MAG: hypothetical protein COC23_08355 [Hyphomicrobiales bacterium]|nr:MAG: hypothetical protein COC23_08355 [Hyphomicrobiales bacterium]